MKVILNNSVYEMRNREYKKFLGLAKKQVPFGIYAVEKESVCEMKNERYGDAVLLQQAVSGYVAQGFKVYYNGGTA